MYALTAETTQLSKNMKNHWAMYTCYPYNNGRFFYFTYFRDRFIIPLKFILALWQISIGIFETNIKLLRRHTIFSGLTFHFSTVNRLFRCWYIFVAQLYYTFMHKPKPWCFPKIIIYFYSTSRIKLSSIGKVCVQHKSLKCRLHFIKD